MIEIGSIAGTYRDTGSQNATKTNDLGKDDFLVLMLAQLENQDPLNPMDSTEFTSQLAEYSSLEQLYNANENLDDIEALQAQDGSFQALDLIGKEILATGNSMALDDTQSATGGFNLSANANCTAYIYDDNGMQVNSLFLGALGPGEHRFQWDGINNSGDSMLPGTYYFEIIAVSEDGQYLPVDPRVTGTVTRINLEGGAPTLYVGDTAVGLSQIVDVRVPQGTSESSLDSGSINDEQE